VRRKGSSGCPFSRLLAPESQQIDRILLESPAPFRAQSALPFAQNYPPPAHTVNREFVMTETSPAEPNLIAAAAAAAPMSAPPPAPGPAPPPAPRRRGRAGVPRAVNAATAGAPRPRPSPRQGHPQPLPRCLAARLQRGYRGRTQPLHLEKKQRKSASAGPYPPPPLPCDTHLFRPAAPISC